MINQILSAKIKKDHVFVEYTEMHETKEGDAITFDVQKKCNCAPHPDMIAAFDRLAPHLINLCEQEAPAKVGEGGKMEYDTDKFKVTGFTIGGEGEHEGVTLIGQKRLANNRVLNLIAPFTKWEDENNGYRHSLEMKTDIELCNYEVEELLNGKKAQDAQTKIEFPE